MFKLFKILTIIISCSLIFITSFLHYKQFPIYEWKLIIEYIKNNRQKEDLKLFIEKLGYDKNDKLLIIHADDVGLSKSVNESTFESFKNKSITSASIIMNSHKKNEALNYAIDNPSYDFGIHLTVTSEWKHHKWGGVIGKSENPSLHNNKGNFFWNKRKFIKNVNIKELEKELQAQIDLSKNIGLKPSHIDSHEGALFFDTNIFKLYIDLAVTNKLLAFVPIEASIHFNDNFKKPKNAVIIDQFHMLSAGTQIEDIESFYYTTINNLKPGISQIIVHLGKNEPKLKEITVDHPNFNYLWRQEDHNVINSKKFKDLIIKNDIKLLSWGDLKKVIIDF